MTEKSWTLTGTFTRSWQVYESNVRARLDLPDDEEVTDIHIDEYIDLPDEYPEYDEIWWTKNE